MLPSPVLSQRSWHPPAAVPGTTKSPSKNDRGSSASPSAILCWNLKHLASEEDYDYFDENNTSAVSSPSSLAADVNGVFVDAFCT
jgi:hypothetical protein